MSDFVSRIKRERGISRGESPTSSRMPDMKARKIMFFSRRLGTRPTSSPLITSKRKGNGSFKENG